MDWLAADGRGLSMPGIQRELISERDETRYRGIERFPIAVGQIRAADRAGKQTVPAEDHTVVVERHVSGGVAGHVHDRELLRANAHAIALRQFAIGGRRSIDADAESQRCIHGYFVQRSFQGMHVDRNGMRLQHSRKTTEVIEVRVRQPDALERRARGPQGREDALRLIAGIDQHRAIRRLIDDEVAVLLERPDGQRLDLHTV